MIVIEGGTMRVMAGGDWRELGVTKDQAYGRQSKTRLGSEKLYEEVTDKLIQEHI